MILYASQYDQSFSTVKELGEALTSLKKLRLGFHPSYFIDAVNDIRNIGLSRTCTVLLHGDGVFL